MTASANAGAPRLTDHELIAEAREWVASCSWQDITCEEDLDEYTDDEVRRGVNRAYDGGWPQFVTDVHGYPPPDPHTQHRRDTVSDATTYSATLAALHDLDARAQRCAHQAQQCTSGAEDLGTSQAQFDTALRDFDLDDTTLGAVAQLREAATGVGLGAGEAATAGTELSVRTQHALEIVGEHHPLAEAVQSHEHAARMDFYRNR